MNRLISIGISAALCLISVGAIQSACSSSKPTCQGAERCDCYPNQTCNEGLECHSNMCVSTIPAGSGGTVGANGGATLVTPVTTGGVVGPGAGGAIAATPDAGSTVPPATGGTLVPATGTGGTVVPPPGSGGTVVLPPGTGGTVVPPPGTGGIAAVDAGAGGSTGTNLVKNGDFSQGKLYWDLTLQAGDVGGYSYSGGEYCVMNESDLLYLSFSLGYPSSPSDAFPVEAGATYTFSYQVSGWGSIEAKIGGAVTPYTEVVTFQDSSSSSTSTFKTVSHTVTPTVSVAQAGLVFNGTLDYSEMVCFQNVSVVKN